MPLDIFPCYLLASFKRKNIRHLSNVLYYYPGVTYYPLVLFLLVLIEGLD